MRCLRHILMVRLHDCSRMDGYLVFVAVFNFCCGCAVGIVVVELCVSCATKSWFKFSLNSLIISGQV